MHPSCSEELEQPLMRVSPPSLRHAMMARLACMALCLTILGSVAVGAAGRLAASSEWRLAADDTKIIYIIRHGEKIFDEANQSAFDYACLSEKGWARAYNLKSVFGPRPMPPFRTPQALFSANYANGVDCRDSSGYRTQATILPLAQTPGGLNLPVDNSSGWLPSTCGEDERGECHTPDPSDPMAEPHDFGMCCNIAAASRMKARLALPGVDAVLACWEHANTRHLALALGARAEHVPAWPGPNYDPVWVLHFDREGNFLSLDATQTQGFSTPHQLQYLGPQRGCGPVAPADFANRGKPTT